MKRILVWCAAVFFLLITSSTVLAAPKVVLDGQQLSFDVSPRIENGCTLVPLRTIFEALGASVRWDANTKTVTATKNETTVRLQINSKTAYKNDAAVVLEAPAKIIENQTLVPLRFVSEAFGTRVVWDNKTQTIIINQNSVETGIDNGDPIVLNDKETPLKMPAVFKGFFKNTDYSHPEYFLYCGAQTKADQNIKEIAKGFNDKKDLTTLKEIYEWTEKNLKMGNGEKFGRTASDIIKSRMYTGCTDKGLAFAAFSREKGIPTVFVQTARFDWIKDLVSNDPNKDFIRGHILVEVFLSDNKWYLVDPSSGKLFLNYNSSDMSLDDGYYIFSKSIEVWDSGIKNTDSNTVTMLKIFKGFDTKKYTPPLYEYINLSSGIKSKSAPYGSALTTLEGSIIMGSKEPSEVFYSRYFNGTNCGLSNERLADTNKFSTAPYIVELYARGANLPGYINDYFPEINEKYENGRIYVKHLPGGQTTILIMGDTNNELINIINKLPDNYFSNK